MAKTELKMVYLLSRYVEDCFYCSISCFTDAGKALAKCSELNKKFGCENDFYQVTSIPLI